MDKFESKAAEEAEERDYDAGDPEQVNKARKKAGRNKAEKLRVVEGIMSVPEGRKWLYEILKRCHVFSTPFQNDPYATAFNCGEQNIGQMLLADIVAAAEDQYVVMCRENSK